MYHVPEVTQTKGWRQRSQPHFPTGARNRQRALAKSGHIAKRRPHNVEQHFDDCGEDFGPLTLLADYCELSVEEEFACAVDSHFGLNGSDFEPERLADLVVPFIRTRWCSSRWTPSQAGTPVVAQVVMHHSLMTTWRNSAAVLQTPAHSSSAEATATGPTTTS